MTDRSPTADRDAGTDDNGGSAASGAETGDRGAGTDGVQRRWLLRALVALGIGIPVVVEARTFVGLFRVHLLGREPAEATTATPTPTQRAGVGVGDELLAGTDPTETVTRSQISVREDGWRYELSVEVTNRTDTPYELRLGGVRTTAGDTVAGGGSTGRIPPGETAVVEESWPLPGENRPETLTVTALTYGEAVELVERTVDLAPASLRG